MPRAFVPLSLALLLFLTSSTPLTRRDTTPLLPAGPGLLRFEPTGGPDAQFLGRAPGYHLLLANGSATVIWPADTVAAARERQWLRMSFVEANPGTAAAGERPLPGQSNYFVGNDPARWRTGVPHYGRVRYPDLYPGIDLIYHGGELLAYDLEVRPGSDPAVIRLAFEGSQDLRLTSDGDLAVDLPGGRIVHQAPSVYQDTPDGRVAVSGHFRLASDGVVGFDIGAYDPRINLTIDPVVLVYSTFAGGGSTETATRTAVDADGIAYITGQTFSTDFPTTNGAFATTSTGSWDAYVVKIDPAQTGANSLVYATYFGSSDRDGALGIAVDDQGRAFVTGWTLAGDFPTTSDAFKGTFSPQFDESDAFITALGPDGDQLFYSTYFGGDRDDAGLDIGLHGASLIYIAGNTDGGTFPTTAGAYNASGRPNTVFLSVLDRTAGALTYSTLVHGGFDYTRGLALDAAGRAYVTGIARSTDWPTTAGAFMPSAPPGMSSAYGMLGSFFVLMDPSQSGASSLVYSSYLGAGDAEDIAVDDSGDAYIVGTTIDPAFPTTPGAFSTTCQDMIVGSGSDAFNAGCAGDAFVMKIDPTQSGAPSLVYSTRLGGSWGEAGNGVAVDAAGYAYVTGSTHSPDFPLRKQLPGTTNPPAGETDAFVAKIGTGGGSLVFSTRLGGVTGPSTSDRGTGIALDGEGAVCVTGSTSTTDFPIVRGFQTSRAGSSDAFFAKLTFNACATHSGVIDGQPFDWDIIPPEICLEWDTDQFGMFTGVPRRCPPPPGCPQCGPTLARVGFDVLPPEFLARVYQAGSGVIDAPRPRTADRKMVRTGWESVAARIGRAEPGRFFTKDVQAKTLGTLKEVIASPRAFRGARGSVLESANAMELDWRTPESRPRKVGTGERVVIDFEEMATLRLGGVEQGGEVALRIQPGLPARPVGYRTGWPLASYRFDFTGRLGRAGRADVEIYTGWIGFEQPGQLRLLEWDGKHFRDVTTSVDYRRGTISGRIDFPYELIIAIPIACYRLELEPINWPYPWQ